MRTFKNISKFTSVYQKQKIFQSFKVQMPGCEISENFENIQSPNSKWILKMADWNKFKVEI